MDKKAAVAHPKERGKGHIKDILVIEGGSTLSGQNNRSRKVHAKKVQTNNTEVDVFHFRPSRVPRSGLTDLIFTDEYLEVLEFPHDDPLVIMALIGNHNVHRILVDMGATSNLMYYSAFKAMGLTKDHTTTSSSTLMGFSGERTRSLGSIKLPMTLGTTPKQVTTLAEFLILDRSPNYNIILGRRTLNKIKSAVSTYHEVPNPPREWINSREQV